MLQLTWTKERRGNTKRHNVSAYHYEYAGEGKTLRMAIGDFMLANKMVDLIKPAKPEPMVKL